MAEKNVNQNEHDIQKVNEFEFEELEQKIAPTVVASCGSCSGCSGCSTSGCGGCGSCSAATA